MNHQLISRTVAFSELELFVADVVSMLEPNPRGATLIRLVGDLGAGKTTFTAVLARLLGVSETVTSPTFVIQKSYQVIHDDFQHLIHVDAYRLETGSDLEKLRFREYLINPTNLICLEWPDIVQDILPNDGYQITIAHKNEFTREFTVTKI